MIAAASTDGLDQRLQAALLFIVVIGSSLALSALLWRWLGTRMRRDRWTRLNYRGERIVAMSGLLVVAAASAVIATALVAADFLVSGYGGIWVSGREISQARVGNSAAVAVGIAVAVLLLGFGWLGYRDDTRGSRSDPRADGPSGFRGHLRLSWKRRRLTTGAQKALGGLIVAFAAAQVALWGEPLGQWDHPSDHIGGWFGTVLLALGLQVEPAGMWSAVKLVRAGLIVALAANLLNLVDRAPGRAAKVTLAWCAACVVPAVIGASRWPGRFGFGLGPEALGGLICAAAVTGAVAGLLHSELAEKHMLGDTGVNPIGAVLGLATVAMYSAAVEWVVLAVLAVLNLASERWSFSRIIDAVPPLRWLDRLGSPYRSN